MPVFCQNILCSLNGFKVNRERYGRAFWEFLEFLEESDRWSFDELKEYQNEKVRFIIAHSYDSVPYYRELMENLKLTPADFKTTEDLPKLPILTKDTIRNRFDDFISTAVPEKMRRYGKTGGTTGKYLKLVLDRDANPRQWAVWWRFRRRFGLDVNDPFIVFAGRDVVPFDQLSPPFWRRNFPMHQTYVSVHHMTVQNIQPLYEYLCTRKVKYYSGYPSGIYLLARYMVDNNLKLPHPPGVVTTGSENLMSHQREIMEKAFDGAIITDQYGACEQCCNISDCEKRHYHVDMEFGAIEFLPLENMPSNVRKIVCTGFWNLAMPFIRYEIGDLATLPEQPVECECGRKSSVVLHIDGRIESYIITPDGRQLGRLGFLFKNSFGIDEAQLVQNDISSVDVNIVKNSRYGTHDEEMLIAVLRKYLGDVIELKLHFLPEIPRGQNGKFRQIVSTIFKDRYSTR